MLGTKCTFQPDFWGAAYRPPTTVRSSTTESPITHVTLCLRSVAI